MRKQKHYPPDRRGHHEPEHHFAERMARRALIESAPIRTEIRDGRVFTVRVLPSGR